MGPRLALILRDIARGGVAGALAGLVVGGIGGRLVMRVAAMLNPDATGRLTESGEAIGAITANGTLALLFFGGLLNGLLAGLIWVIASPWIPWSGGRRILAGAFLAVALGAPLLLLTTRGDFVTLDQDLAILVLLVGLVGLVGAGVALADARLDRALPRPTGFRSPSTWVYAAVTLLGLLVVPLAVGFYLSPETCGCANPPRPAGWALIAVGLTTAGGWLVAVATGRTDPPPALRAIGRLSLLAAAGLGTVRLVGELTGILGAA